MRGMGGEQHESCLKGARWTNLFSFSANEDSPKPTAELEKNAPSSSKAGARKVWKGERAKRAASERNSWSSWNKVSGLIISRKATRKQPPTSPHSDEVAQNRHECASSSPRHCAEREGRRRRAACARSGDHFLPLSFSRLSLHGLCVCSTVLRLLVLFSLGRPFGSRKQEVMLSRFMMNILLFYLVLHRLTADSF